MKEREPSVGASERNYDKTERMARLLACGVFALGMVGCETNDEQTAPRPSVSPFTYEHDYAPESLPPDRPGPLDDMAIVIARNPARKEPHVFSDTESVKRIFRMADAQLASVTNGDVSLPNNMDLYEMNVYATGHTEGVPCYTDKDLKKVDKAVEGDGVMVLLDETPACLEIKPPSTVQPSAWAYSGTKTVVFGNRAPLQLGTILHEAGHVADLSHHTVIGESRDDDGEKFIFSAKPLDKRLQDAAFDVARLESGAVDEYAASTSVMGNTVAPGMAEVFHPVELAKMTDSVSVPTVEAHEATYVVKARGSSLRGVQFELPPDHPLKRIDDAMATVSIATVPHITPGAGQINQINIAVTAESPTMLYDIYALPPVSFCVQDDACESGQKGWATVFKDEALGIEVRAAKRDSDLIDLRVETIR